MTDLQKFFISFNSRDRDKAHWIAWTLRAAGHEVAVHDWELPAGGNVPAWMSERLGWADRVIAVVSPDYTSAVYSMMEWAAKAWEDPLGKSGAVIPVIVRPTPNLPPLLKGLSQINLTGIDEDKAKEMLLNGVSLPRPPSSKPAFNVVPPVATEMGPREKPEFDPTAANALEAADQKRPTPEEAILHVVSGDPLRIESGKKVLSGKADLFSDLLDSACTRSTVISKRAVREILATGSRRSSDLLMSRCFDSSGKLTSWEKAVKSVDFFSPANREYCQDRLADIAERGRWGFDEQRIAIEAMGRCASPGWGSVIAFLPAREGFDGKTRWEGYRAEKIGSYVVEALARMVTHSKGGSFGELSTSLSNFLGALRISEESSHQSISFHTLLDILSECGPEHVDGIITKLLKGASPTGQRLAASVLGILRIERSVLHLIEVAESNESDMTVRDCSEAIGQIGSQDAVNWLLSNFEHPKRNYGVAFALHRMPKDFVMRHAPQMVETGHHLKYMAIRALGCVGAHSFGELIRRHLSSTDSLERSAAIIALSRLDSVSERDLDVFIREAADELDHLFGRLALIVISPRRTLELLPKIREILARDSYRYNGLLQDDIIEYLKVAGVEEAARLARAWCPYYSAIYNPR